MERGEITQNPLRLLLFFMRMGPSRAVTPERENWQGEGGSEGQENERQSQSEPHQEIDLDLEEASAIGVGWDYPALPVVEGNGGPKWNQEVGTDCDDPDVGNDVEEHEEACGVGERKRRAEGSEMNVGDRMRDWDPGEEEGVNVGPSFDRARATIGACVCPFLHLEERRVDRAESGARSPWEESVIGEKEERSGEVEGSGRCGPQEHGP